MPGSEPALNNYLVVGALLFTLGLVGFLTRRNLIIIFLCAELMLQGVSVTLVGFSGFHGTWGGQVLAVFSLALAAAEAGVGLALFVVLFRRADSLDVSIWHDLREADQPAVVDESLPDEPVEQPRWPHLPPAGRLPTRAVRDDGRPAPQARVAARQMLSAGEAHGGPS
ncbi:MAG: NADH-quinone oxidoreductase subunit NuoK [Planctomycetaceae bacterium]